MTTQETKRILELAEAIETQPILVNTIKLLISLKGLSL